MSANKPCHCEEGLPEWIMSYADMITILMAFLVVGVAIPTPGMVGGFHAFYLLALADVYGVPRATAAAAAVAAHALSNLPVLVCGLVLLGREGLSLGRVAEVTREQGKLSESEVRS